MRGALLGLLLLGCGACASQDDLSVTVEVRYPTRLGLASNPRRIMSMDRGSTVEDATRQLIRNPWQSGLHANSIDVYNRMLWRSTDNDPRSGSHWAWSLNGAYPQTTAADWVLKPGDVVVWSYER